MNKHRISAADLVLGEPLLWDVYDEHGVLLLSRGHVIENHHQIEELVERGLFADAANFSRKPAAPSARVKELPSVLHLLDTAERRLEHLLFGFHLEQDAPVRLREIAQVLAYAAGLNPDIALASILLDQEVHSYTVRHSIDTAIVALLVAKALKRPEEEIASLTAAALTMNLGMLRRHNAFQAKSSPLTEAEQEVIRRHPEESVRLLQQAGVTDPAWLSCVLHHHENEDGSGYPAGKSGADIPLNAKIVSLADRYCARITGRVYRKPLLPSVALRGLFVDERKCVDTHLAPCFIEELGVYPPGSIVRLQNGETAIVTQRGKTATTPVVHAYLGPWGAPLSFPIRRETAKELFAVRSALDLGEAPLPFSPRQIWGAEAAL